MEKAKSKKWVRIKEYANIHGYTDDYVRHLIIRGKLKCRIIDGKKCLDSNIKPDVGYKSFPYFEGRKSHTRIYRIWQGMKRRCTDKKHTGYRFYGARGIKVCNEWLKSSDAFIEWAYNNGYADDLEIDRIDGTGNYEPSNCRWVSHDVNNANRIFGRVENNKDYDLLRKTQRANSEMNKLKKQFGFKSEEWFEEMKGYIWKKYGLTE